MADHNGSIEVQSKVKKGSTFRLRFPVTQSLVKAHEERICVAILAGGQSSRMGVNKALLELNGKRMIEHVIAAVQKTTNELFLITNNPEEYKFLDLPVFRDMIQGIGPLGGIYTSLRRCATDHCLIVACDLPFISEQLLRFLAENARDYDIFAIDSPRGMEPLCAVYSKSCLPAIEKQIEQKNYKVVDLFRGANTRLIRFDTKHSLYSSNLFYNVNTPDELTVARRLISGEAKEA